MQVARNYVASEAPSRETQTNQPFNNPISFHEVSHHVFKAKNGKAISVDGIPNEVLKNTTSIEMLTQIFNTFFNESIIPKMWKRSFICPIYKGGQKEKREPLSYRPISLISNPCKIFSSIMNSRLLEFLDNNSILVEEQNGFRKNRNCLEHIFTLSSIVGSRLQEKKHTFCCFVDFSKAFDFVNRDLLLFALKQIGINGKFLNMFKAMYDETEAAVKINDKITHWFHTKAGVRQGQNDSPTAFSILINSLAKDLIQLRKGIQYGTAYVTVLLYADDIVILSDCEENMQIQLNKLSAWCKKWRMNINIDKTKII